MKHMVTDGCMLNDYTPICDVLGNMKIRGQALHAFKVKFRVIKTSMNRYAMYKPTVVPSLNIIAYILSDIL